MGERAVADADGELIGGGALGLGRGPGEGAGAGDDGGAGGGVEQTVGQGIGREVGVGGGGGEGEEGAFVHGLGRDGGEDRGGVGLRNRHDKAPLDRVAGGGVGRQRVGGRGGGVVIRELQAPARGGVAEIIPTVLAGGQGPLDVCAGGSGGGEGGGGAGDGAEATAVAGGNHMIAVGHAGGYQGPVDEVAIDPDGLPVRFGGEEVGQAFTGAFMVE